MSDRPALPYFLGLAGLIPFICFALLIVLGLGVDPSSAQLGLIGYGAVILSFLGGTRWGTEIHRNSGAPNSIILSLAMLPSLAGWAAILLWLAQSSGWALGLLVAGLSLQLMWDMTAIRNGTYPDWYMPLRVLLTGVAITSLLAAIFL